MRAVSDETLLLVGCLVTFIACAGGYLGLREGFSYGRSTSRAEAERDSESNARDIATARAAGAK